MIPENRAATHPGEILAEEFLKPMNVTQVALAAKLKVPVQRVNTLISGKRGVTPETAILLAMAFDTTPQFWMNLQSAFDLWHQARSIQTKIVPFTARGARLRPSSKARGAGSKRSTRSASRRVTKAAR